MSPRDRHVQEDRQLPMHGTYLAMQSIPWPLVGYTIVTDEQDLADDPLHLVSQAICISSTSLSPYGKNLHTMPKNPPTYSHPPIMGS